MKEPTLKEEVRKFALERYLMTEHSDAVLDKIVDLVIQSIREKLPPSNSDEHYADNLTEAEHGWDNYRNKVLTLLDTLTSHVII